MGPELHVRVALQVQVVLHVALQMQGALRAKKMETACQKLTRKQQ